MMRTTSDDGVAETSRGAMPELAAEADSPYPTIEGEPRAAGSENGERAGADPGRLDLVFDVPVRLSVELGRAEILIRDVVNLSRGSVIELDRSPGDALEVRCNGVLIGRGEIVVVNEERLGLRFVEVVSQAERVKRLG